MPAGRPSKYQPAYCNEVVSFCEQGYSLTAFAGEIGVDRASITRWCEEHEEFRTAVNRAKAKRAAHWEKLALQVAQSGGTGAQATLIVFGLKNHAPDEFRDKQEHEHTGPGGAALIPVLNVTITNPDQSQSASEAGPGAANDGD